MITIIIIIITAVYVHKCMYAYGRFFVKAMFRNWALEAGLGVKETEEKTEKGIGDRGGGGVGIVRLRKGRARRPRLFVEAEVFQGRGVAKCVLRGSLHKTFAVPPEKRRGLEGVHYPLEAHSIDYYGEGQEDSRITSS